MKTLAKGERYTSSEVGEVFSWELFLYRASENEPIGTQYFWKKTEVARGGEPVLLLCRKSICPSCEGEGRYERQHGWSHSHDEPITSEVMCEDCGNGSRETEVAARIANLPALASLCWELEDAGLNPAVLAFPEELISGVEKANEMAGAWLRGKK